MKRYYVKNKSGNVSDVTKELYAERKKDSNYECWVEKAEVPAEVEELSLKSKDMLVEEALEIAKDLDEEELATFTEGDDRKTIKKLLE